VRHYNTARDFAVGNTLEVHSHMFQLLATDRATENIFRELGMM
jgi:hypothetical protein